MKPLVRLLDDPTLAPEARADLDLVIRNAYQPELVHAQQALLAALAAEPGHPSLNASSASSAQTVAAAKTGAVHTAWSTLAPALKVTLVALGGAAALGVPAWQYFELAPVQRARPATTVQPQSSARVEPAAQTPSQPSAADPIAQVVPEPPAVHPGSESRREIAQLQRIQALLAREPARAYSLARASQREFPSGPLQQEREGLAVLALWQLGEHARARPLTERFLGRYPDSPLAERMRTLLREPRP